MPLIEIFDLRLLVAAGLGAAIGLERALAGKDPSLRTFALICMGSCIFTFLSVHSSTLTGQIDPSRIAAQVVVGIGFIGAGAIFRSPRGVSGLTTAALMWVTAGIGMAVGFDQVELAVSATVTAVSVTFFLNLIHRLIRKIRPKAYSRKSDVD